MRDAQQCRLHLMDLQCVLSSIKFRALLATARILRTTGMVLLATVSSASKDSVLACFSWDIVLSGFELGCLDL